MNRSQRRCKEVVHLEELAEKVMYLVTKVTQTLVELTITRIS